LAIFITAPQCFGAAPKRFEVPAYYCFVVRCTSPKGAQHSFRKAI
jgi:hypothetical protein